MVQLAISKSESKSERELTFRLLKSSRHVKLRVVKGIIPDQTLSSSALGWISQEMRMISPLIPYVDHPFPILSPKNGIHPQGIFKRFWSLKGDF